MDDDLHQLGEDLVTTAARIVRWLPTDGMGLSLSAARVLARISDNGPSRISDLAVQERCSQPTITNHIKRLEKSGLVDRVSDPKDARAWIIDLTPQGREQLSSLRASLGTNVEPHLARMNKRDQKALRDGITAMRRLMEAQKS